MDGCINGSKGLHAGGSEDGGIAATRDGVGCAVFKSNGEDVWSVVLVCGAAPCAGDMFVGVGIAPSDNCGMKVIFVPIWILADGVGVWMIKFFMPPCSSIGIGIRAFPCGERVLTVTVTGEIGDAICGAFPV